jgi:hypothetical protein
MTFDNNRYAAAPHVCLHSDKCLPITWGLDQRNRARDITTR